MKSPTHTFSFADSNTKIEAFDAVLLPLAPSVLDAVGSDLGSDLRAWIDPHRNFLKQIQFESNKPGSLAAFDIQPGLRLVFAVLPRHERAFEHLELARKTLDKIKDVKPRRTALYVPGEGPRAGLVADAFVSAHIAAGHVAPRLHLPEKPKTSSELVLLTPAAVRDEVEALATRAAQWTEATNLVRWLSERAGNDLSPTEYLKTASRLATEHDLGVQFISLEKLETMGAGAFVAVARGAEDPDQGVLKITYKPHGVSGVKPVALVGKGITFDTGGNNIKTGPHMYGMHADMAGSAVCLALCLLAKQQAWPFPVHAYLAIAQNAVGPKSYRPNDVVRSLSGKTIEIIDTDAEGRLVLADTLTLASGEQPQLILDFATLTGACVRAIGTIYGGVFSNRRRLLQTAVRAGRESGERVWPFPNDPDYATCLESDFADIRQCRTSGGVDHIEASLFLSRFVPRSIPWMHLDLSAIENEGGLAHVGSKMTGFGARVGAQLIASWFAK